MYPGTCILFISFWIYPSLFFSPSFSSPFPSSSPSFPFHSSYSSVLFICLSVFPCDAFLLPESSNCFLSSPIFKFLYFLSHLFYLLSQLIFKIVVLTPEITNIDTTLAFSISSLSPPLVNHLSFISSVYLLFQLQVHILVWHQIQQQMLSLD